MRWSSVALEVMYFVIVLEKFLARAKPTAAAKNTPPPHQCLLDVVLQASRMRLDALSVEETCDASNRSRSCSYWPIDLSSSPRMAPNDSPYHRSYMHLASSERKRCQTLYDLASHRHPVFLSTPHLDARLTDSNVLDPLIRLDLHSQTSTLLRVDDQTFHAQTAR